MKRELDLLREFAELNDAKVEGWGTLPVAAEKRYRELRAFYDELMTRRAYQRIPASERYGVDEIRTQLPSRDRLRVPLDMTLFFCHDDAYAPARVVNLSRGGIFLGSAVTLTADTRLTLYMPNLGRGYESLFETEVDVVWSSRERRLSERRGMGVRFRELRSDADAQLDDFIVAFLRERLSRTAQINSRPGCVPEGRAAI